ncbi:hypothetical protein ACFQT0_28805, partial [Hymenobacter humi]
SKHHYRAICHAQARSIFSRLTDSYKREKVLRAAQDDSRSVQDASTNSAWSPILLPMRLSYFRGSTLKSYKCPWLNIQ